MINEDINFYFLDELYRLQNTEKRAGILTEFGEAFGKQLAHHGKEFVEGSKQYGKQLALNAAAPVAVFHPTGKYLREGWEALSNMNPKSLQAMREGIAETAKGGRTFVPDFHAGEGVLHTLRRGGWLSNTPKYVGDSSWEKLKNLGFRALPGQRSVTMIPATADALSTLTTKEDKQTGRKIGLGERVGGAGMSLATGIAAAGLAPPVGAGGIAGSLVGGTIGGLMGGAVGTRAGRLLDTGVNRLRGRGTTPAQVSPASAVSVQTPVAHPTDSTPIGTPQ